MRRVSDNDIVISSDDRIASSVQDQPRRVKVKARRNKAKVSVSQDAAPRDVAPALPKTRSKRRALPRLRLTLTPLQKLAAGGVALTAIIVGSAVIWHSGIIQRTTHTTLERALTASVQAGFQIRDITVAGRGRTSMEDIAAALTSRHGGPILAVDLEDVKDRLEAIPSVQQAAVERRLPDGLHISIVERIPMAVWQQNGRHVLVDRAGHVIPGPITGYEDLPLVVGDGAAARAEELLTMLKSEPGMAARVKASVRVGNRRWNLMLDDPYHGLEIRLPEDQAEAAWHRLAQLEKEQALTSRRLSMIDLRAPDRLILKTERPASPDEAAKAKDNGA